MSDFLENMRRTESIESVIGEVQVMDDARKQRIREMTKRKLETLTKQNLARQTHYFGETQHKFMKTTNEQGGVVDDDEDDPNMRKSMYQTMKEATSLFNCVCCPCLRPQNEDNFEDEEEEEVNQ